MTDEKSGQSFNTVPAAPGGPSYLPSAILTRLHPGEVQVVTLQFPVPPPPQNEAELARQTVSILLPNAKAPISGLVIPRSVAGAPSR